ncbi:centromere-associated protein E [Nilaparvata lugens]|uniref:centromere-associated protein E n=1 Tax=Nilaparvata lugens TaxID=108931 RepID=UPI00193DDD2C|nr:centromere-associated protein E [Nilaparvata lugens]
MSDKKIKVAIRVRPLIEREKNEGLQLRWTTEDNKIYQIDPANGKSKGDAYTFDHIFGSSESNDKVFDTIIKPIIDASMQGFNGTVFAYGQTSSGKTYTMSGDQKCLGIIQMAINYIFYSIENTPRREFLLRVSYMEIYNEKVNDLLDITKKNLKIQEDCNGHVVVSDVEERVCKNSTEVLEEKMKGDKNRRIGETNMNERSSRSHTIFRIILESRSTDDEDGAVKVSHLNLVDLAGSERSGQSGATGDRFKEGCHINMSLTTLGIVINQLSEIQEGQNPFINFRDSKLTRLLQSSLGGNAMTVIVCAVTPAAEDQTQNTINFASRAKRINNKPILNEVLSESVLIKRYLKQIAKLNQELEVCIYLLISM